MVIDAHDPDPAMSSPAAPEAVAADPGALARFFAGDVWYSFTRSPVAIVSTVLVLICVVSAVFAPWLAPHNPFDLASLNLSDARLPPFWMAPINSAKSAGLSPELPRAGARDGTRRSIGQPRRAQR